MKIQCNCCKNVFTYTKDDIQYDESGYGYSTKIVKCNKCGYIKILEYIEDKSLDINKDKRYYTY